MATSFLSVGGLLSAYPTLRFDLEEYLLSKPYAASLRERWEGFLRYLEGETSGRVTQCRIVERIRARLSQSVRAYASLRGTESFFQIPLIHKCDLVTRAEEFQGSVSAGNLWSKTTSGTSGPAVTVLYSPSFYFGQLHLSVRKVMAFLGQPTCWQDGQVWCVHITDTQNSGERIIKYPTADGELSAQILVSSATQETFRSAAEFLNHVRPTVITSRPELLEMMAETVAGSHYFAKTPPRYVVSSGSTLDDKRRKFLNDELNTRVVNAYGLSEFGLTAWECHAGCLHVDETTVLAEVLMENNAPAEEGEIGELVLSSIDNEAMPLIRYATGDRAQSGPSQCACGMPGRVLKKILGRQVPCFRFSSGLPFSPTIFNDVQHLFPVAEYQITQIGPSDIDVIIEPRSILACDDLRAAVSEHVRARVPSDVRTTVRIGKLSDGRKFQRYRQTFHIH